MQDSKDKKDTQEESELIKQAREYLKNNQIHKAEALLSYCRKIGLLIKDLSKNQSED